jgi:iron complex outermembrane receptor protein
MQNFRLITVILLLVTSTILNAQQTYNSLLQSINNDLKKYENRATKTRKNEHYQPYIISVLETETLKKIGVQKLEDAIMIVTGIDISNDNVDYKSPIFRGSNPSAFGQSKLFIDGVLVNNVYLDGYSEYLDMPIELIKRVEVIRGPGNEDEEIASYAGSIHVITYAENMGTNGSIFSKLGSDCLKVGGFKKGYKNGEFSLFTDFYYKESDERVFANSDILKSGIYDIKTPFYTLENSKIASSGDIPLWLKNYSLGLNLKYKDLSFKGRLYQYKHGAAFGFNYMIPQHEDSLEFPNHYAEILYKKELSNINIIAKLGLKYDGIQSDQHLIHKGVSLPKLSNPKESVTLENGAYGIHEAKQRIYYHGLDFKYSGIKKHNINLGYYISKIDTVKVVSKITNRDTGVGIVDYSNTLPFFDKDASRDSFIMTIQDSYNYNDNLKLQYGLNYENNTDIDEQINPKLSLVYSPKTDNIFKFLYASSHRNPSWQEIYTLNNQARVGNRDLKAEKIHTFEFAHIKHFTLNSFIQTTLFYLINRDQIHNITKNNQYINSEKNNYIRGVEIEYKGNLLPNDSIYFNLSYIHGSNSYDNTLSQVSDILLKGYYIYNLKENLSLSTVAKYSSSKDRLSYDTRDNISGTTTIDTTISYKNYKNSYRINFGIKNIFDKKIVYASKPYTYEDDYATVGRSFILSYEKEF